MDVAGLHLRVFYVEWSAESNTVVCPHLWRRQHQASQLATVGGERDADATGGEHKDPRERKMVHRGASYERGESRTAASAAARRTSGGNGGRTTDNGTTTTTSRTATARRR